MAHNTKARRGFTLVELLVVVLILAILMSLALPFYLSAIRNSEKQTARTNMQTISTAEQAYRSQVSDHSYIGGTSEAGGTLSQKLPDLPNGLAGPGNRTYEVKTDQAGKTCKDASGTSVTVPTDGIEINSVGTDGANDGCFVPGVTTN